MVKGSTSLANPRAEEDTRWPKVVLPSASLSSPLCRNDYRFRVDGFADNGDVCNDYKNTGSAVTANRRALRNTANDVAAQLSLTVGVDYEIVSLATKCNNPPDGARGPGKNRKRLRTIIVISLMSNKAADFLNALRAKVAGHVFANYAVGLGAGIWVPMPFTYNNGANAVCLPQYTSIGGACGAAWRPNQITPI